MHSEYVARLGVSVPLHNSFHDWLVILELKPKATVSLSRPVRIGKHTHRWWRDIEEFKYSEIKGRLLHFERHEDGLTREYRLVFVEVEGYNVKDLKIHVRLNDIVSIKSLRIGRKHDWDPIKGETPAGLVRNIKPCESEAKELTIS